MKPVAICVGGALVAALGGCAVVPPNGPSVAVLPGQGKSYEQFQYDDQFCRQAATQSNGGAYEAQNATNNAVGSAAVGTVVGAAAGALIGAATGHPGAGAAVGAGAGLLTGSAVGANGAQYSAYGMQRNYDVTYIQCMSAKGNQVPQYASDPQPVVVQSYPAPYPVYVAPYGYGYGGYGPGYYRPYRRW